MSRISTPCVSYCWIDPTHGHCEGCGRTKAEIASWCFIEEEQRLAIMAQLEERMAELEIVPPGRVKSALNSES